MSDLHPLMIEDPAAAREFVFGGSAVFTLVSKKTGTRFTYRVSKAKDKDDMFFASTLSGPDNLSDYSYIGFIRTSGNFPGLLTSGAKGKMGTPSYSALAWFLNQLAKADLPDTVEMWHEGRCMKCARRLTDPASIKRGLGPECAGKHSEGVMA